MTDMTFICMMLFCILITLLTATLAIHRVADALEKMIFQMGSVKR